MMKKYIYILYLPLIAALPAFSQSEIREVLKNIEANNPALQAGIQLNLAQKLEARTGIFLPNPTIELNQLWTDRNVGGNVNELAVVQSFDFPTVYANKNKLAKLKSTTFDLQYAATRQEILLTAQQTCQEIIYLRKQKQLLKQRLKNAEKLAELYRQRFVNGDANQLEYNKILLEKINAKNACRLNNSALQAQLEKLQALNGGQPIAFNSINYPHSQVLPEYSSLESEYLATDPTLKSLRNESESAQREIKVNRTLTLPKFDLGYRRNGGSESKMNGFKIGLSIPLWENKNTVKQAKAQAEYTITNALANQLTLKTTLRELYLQAEALADSRNEYAEALSCQRNDELLNKALEAGQISMIDYFVEITLLYNSMQNYLNVEKEYQNAMARLLQYQL